MPLAWKIDADDKVMVAVANGDVIRAEVESFLDAIVEGNALAYRKLFDVHRGDTPMTADDLLPLALRMQSLHTLGRMGPLAVVLPEGRGKRLRRALGLVATADRPMRLFEDPILACRWLGKQEIPGAAAPEGGATDTLEWRARARYLAAAIRRLAKGADTEAARKRPAAEHLVYRGRDEITYRGTPLNICVKQVGPTWEFRCCGADRLTRGTLLTLEAEELATALAKGENPLAATLARLKDLAQAGRLAIPDTSTGVY